MVDAKDKIKIFVVYHKIDLPLFKNEIYQPILTAATNKPKSENFFCDDAGINISEKNRSYGDITAQYWVRQNYLKENPSVEYIGFNHYRRFFNFMENKNLFPFVKHFYKTFKKKIFDKYNADEIYDQIKDYDIIMPSPEKIGISCYDKIAKYHTKEALEKTIKIINEKFPDYVPYMEEFLKSNSSYVCLNFVMKRELFADWIEWITKVCELLEKEIDLSKYNEYYTERIFGYTAERFINVWLRYQIKTKNLKVAERDTYMLTHLGAKEYNFLGIKYFVEETGEKYLNIFDFDIILDFKRIAKWLHKHLIQRGISNS